MQQFYTQIVFNTLVRFYSPLAGTAVLFCFMFLFGTRNAQAQQNENIYYRYDELSRIYHEDFRTENRDSLPESYFLDSLVRTGYHTLKVDSIVKTENSVAYYLKKGKLYNKLSLKQITKNKTIDFGLTSNPDSIINHELHKLEKQGFAFAKARKRTHGTSPDGILEVSFTIDPGAQRWINGYRVQGYDKLPKSFLRHGLGIPKKAIYNQENLNKIKNRLNRETQIRQTRSPQTLFTKDSTHIYLYLEKRKSNFFDGILGFGNDNQGEFRLNGNVLLELNNNFNGFERIRLHWNANDQRNSTLEINTRIPYLFRSAVGLNFDFRVFRKDSTFVNTGIRPSLFYPIHRNATLGATFSYESSNYVLADSLVTVGAFQDYNKTGFGLAYRYYIPSEKPLFEGDWNLNLIGNVLSVSDATSRSQYEVGLRASRIQRLFKKHYLKLNLEAFALLSEDNIFNQNELYRYGGFGSLRGFNEESLVANAYGLAGLEYRFVPSDSFYISTFLDYSILENKSLDIQENLLGTGLGFSFLSKIGVFNLTYAVGKFSDTSFDFSNNRVHFGILSRF